MVLGTVLDVVRLTVVDCGTNEENDFTCCVSRNDKTFGCLEEVWKTLSAVVVSHDDVSFVVDRFDVGFEEVRRIEDVLFPQPRPAGPNLSDALFADAAEDFSVTLTVVLSFAPSFVLFVILAAFVATV